MRLSGVIVVVLIGGLAACGSQPIDSAERAEREIRERIPGLTVDGCGRRTDSTGWVCSARDGARALECHVAPEVQREITVFCDEPDKPRRRG